MLDDPIKYGLLASLAIALLVAAYTDLKSRRIANWLNGAIALGAPVFWWASSLPLLPEGASWLEPASVVTQLALAVTMFFALSLLFALKWMGGGDVKLLVALSLWLAPYTFLKLFVLMTLIGGLLTLVLWGWHVMRRRKGRPLIPYGVAISAAGLWIIHGALFAGFSSAGAAG